MMRALQKLAVVAVAALAAPLANATVVTTWAYQVDTVFKVGSECFQAGFDGTGAQSGLGCPAPTADPADTATSPLQVSWGIPAGGTGPSRLFITNSQATGTVDTTTPPFSIPTGSIPPGNEIGLTNIFNHDNQPIALGHTLDFIDVNSFLTLTPIVPPGGLPGTEPPVVPFAPAGPLQFHVNFAETTNQANCNPPGSTHCPDIFVISGPFGTPGAFNIFSFTYDFDGPGGEEPHQYFISIFPFPQGSQTPLQTLPDAACIKAGAPVGCQGFLTEEGQLNSIQFAFAITTTPLVFVPEPSGLALFAAALVVLGVALRRKQA